MSLLFDALKRDRETKAGETPAEDNTLIMDLSEPEVGERAEHDDRKIIDHSEPATVTPPVANPATTIPSQKEGRRAAQSIISATKRPSQRIVTLAVSGVVILLLAGGGGLWYYQQIMNSLVSHPAIITPPLASTAIETGVLTQPAVEPLPIELPDQANVEQITTGTTPAPVVPSPSLSNTTADQELEQVAAGGSAEVPDTHASQTPPEQIAPARNKGQATASLVPLIAKTAREKKTPAKKSLPKKRLLPPPQTEQPVKADSPPKPDIASPPETHVRLSAGRDPLHEGYQALTEGRLDDAESLYQEVLTKHPQERDALLGLAVIAHRKMQPERASDLYRLVLREDPGNTTATAALVTLSMEIDPAAAESRLKQLLDKKPTSPELHHALGSILARQKRWGEAQQEFFRAYTLTPDNALYAYNLAIALDHLHKSAAALPYYEKSAQILPPGDTAIDLKAIERRVQELRSSLPH